MRESLVSATAIEPAGEHRPVRTIYYDADDLRLTRWGGSLRFRSPNEWRLTVPPPDERLAYATEYVFEGPRGAIPAAALDLATAYLRGVVPRPVADVQLLRAVPDLALDPGTPPDLVAPPIDRRTRIDDVVRAALIGSVHQLINADVALRLGGDATAVHRARVAVRRLRSDARTFRPVLDPAWADALRERIRWLGDALAAARDADVLLERLQRHAARLPDVDNHRKELVLNLLRGVRAAAYRQLGTMLRQPRYVRVLADLLEAVRTPRFNERAGERAGDAAPELLDDAWRALRRTVRARSHPASDAELHGIRIKAKRLRYAAEAFVPVCGKRAATFAARVANLQTILGEHHDATSSCDHLRRNLGGGDGAFVAGELAALERDAAFAARRRWLGAWRDVDRDGAHFWL
jgi:CHAD domain-containing protein